MDGNIFSDVFKSYYRMTDLMSPYSSSDLKIKCSLLLNHLKRSLVSMFSFALSFFLLELWFVLTA
jgi:hypothetical protein